MFNFIDTSQSDVDRLSSGRLEVYLDNTENTIYLRDYNTGNEILFDLNDLSTNLDLSGETYDSMTILSLFTNRLNFQTSENYITYNEIDQTINFYINNTKFLTISQTDITFNTTDILASINSNQNRITLNEQIIDIFDEWFGTYDNSKGTVEERLSDLTVSTDLNYDIIDIFDDWFGNYNLNDGTIQNRLTILETNDNTQNDTLDDLEQEMQDWQDYIDTLGDYVDVGASVIDKATEVGKTLALVTAGASGPLVNYLINNNFSLKSLFDTSDDETTIQEKIETLSWLNKWMKITENDYRISPPGFNGYMSFIQSISNSYLRIFNGDLLRKTELKAGDSPHLFMNSATYGNMTFDDNWFAQVDHVREWLPYSYDTSKGTIDSRITNNTDSISSLQGIVSNNQSTISNNLNDIDEIWEDLFGNNTDYDHITEGTIQNRIESLEDTLDISTDIHLGNSFIFTETTDATFSIESTTRNPIIKLFDGIDLETIEITDIEEWNQYDSRITANTSNISTNNSDISTLQTQMTTVRESISGTSYDYDYSTMGTIQDRLDTLETATYNEDTELRADIGFPYDEVSKGTISSRLDTIDTTISDITKITDGTKITDNFKITSTASTSDRITSTITDTETLFKLINDSDRISLKVTDTRSRIRLITGNNTIKIVNDTDMSITFDDGTTSYSIDPSKISLWSTFDSRITNNEIDISNILSDYNDIENMVLTIQEHLSGVLYDYNNSTPLYDRMNNAEASITSLQSTTSTNSTDIDSLQTTTSTNTSDIDSLQSITSTNSSDIDSLQSTTSTLQTTTSTNTTDISNIKADIGFPYDETTNGTIISRLDNLESSSVDPEVRAAIGWPYDESLLGTIKIRLEKLNNISHWSDGYEFLSDFQMLRGNIYEDSKFRIYGSDVSNFAAWDIHCTNTFANFAFSYYSSLGSKDSIFKFETDGTFTCNNPDTDRYTAIQESDIELYNGTNSWIIVNTDTDILQFLFNSTLKYSFDEYGISLYNSSNYWFITHDDSDNLEYRYNGTKIAKFFNEGLFRVYNISNSSYVGLNCETAEPYIKLSCDDGNPNNWKILHNTDEDIDFKFDDNLIAKFTNNAQFYIYDDNSNNYIMSDAGTSNPAIILKRDYGSGTTHQWGIEHYSNQNLYFRFNGSAKAYIDEDSYEGQLDFTGAHTCEHTDENFEIGRPVYMTGQCTDNPNYIWERLPIVSPTGTQKKFYGIYLEQATDENYNIHYKQGNFISIGNRGSDRIWIGAHGNMSAYVQGPVEAGDSLMVQNNKLVKDDGTKQHLRNIMALEDITDNSEILIGIEM